MSHAMSVETIEGLREILGAEGLLEADADLSHYEAGWRYGQGRALAVARPRRTAEVAALAAFAAARGLRLKAQGANTGLVGASNPDESGEQLVVSFERFAANIEIDPIARTARVDAGVTLSALNEAAAREGLFFPIDLGADPQIGGMIATNTGGTRLIRYGSVRDHLLGLEVVLPDGRVWSELSELRKDNRGPDLRSLFVGSSGQYGFVTRAVVSLAPRPRQVVTAWAALADAQGALDLLAHLERDFGETLSAYEVVSAEAFAATLRHGANLSDPFGGARPPRAALIELSMTIRRDHFDLEAAMMASFEAFLEHGEEALIDVTPQSPVDAWNIRHQISESLRHEGRVLALDVSLPRQEMPAFQSRVAAWLREKHPEVRACDFGHWGDGGTHLNLVWDSDEGRDESARKEELQAEVYAICVRDFAGSFSAEHGLGPHNRRHHEELSAAHRFEIEALLGRHFDPEGRHRL
jgi:FAD/FMN-containing dehydrogenase